MGNAGAETKKAKPTQHHHGHRDRLRARFIKAGPEGIADYELLELLLFSALPRRDVKPLAKTLINSFGSFGRVMTAELHELSAIKGISENTAVLIKTVQSAARMMLKEQMAARPVLSSWQALLDYLHLSMAYEKREHFRILFLNRRNELISDEVQQTGTVDHTAVYPREIMRRALELSATAIILVHNHPSGDAEPSTPDIDMTEAIIRAAATFELIVHDHLIIGQNGYTSFKSLGLI
ncbi:MAG: RadC family protein [Pseudomonadota bacterium]